MRSWLLLPMFVMACPIAQAGAELYRWVDAQGNVHYSDQPPPPTIKQFEKMKAVGGKPGEAPLPYALQQAVSNFPVTLYITECGEACTHARSLLARRAIPYTELDATEAQTQQDLRKITGGPLEVPVLQVGRDTLRGFEESQWNASLDAAGYPRTALIPPRPPIRPVKPAEKSPTAAQPAGAGGDNPPSDAVPVAPPSAQTR